MNIEFEPVCAGRHTEIERDECIFRTEGAAAAVREHNGAPAVEESHYR